MYISFSNFDDDGQSLPGFSIEVKYVILAGIVKEGIQFDVCHVDDEQERLVLEGTPYDLFTLGNLKNVMQARFLDTYPATTIISKEEFRAMVGKGKILNKAKGYYE